MDRGSWLSAPGLICLFREDLSGVSSTLMSRVRAMGFSNDMKATLGALDMDSIMAAFLELISLGRGNGVRVFLKSCRPESCWLRSWSPESCTAGRGACAET